MSDTILIEICVDENFADKNRPYRVEISYIKQYEF